MREPAHSPQVASTLMEAVERAARQLRDAGLSFGHGTDNAFDEAVWMVLWRLGLPLDALDAEALRPLEAAQAQSVQALVDERIRTRRPAAYLMGEAWLQGLPFDVDERVIVPRSFIAELIADGTLQAWQHQEPPRRVWDLCTGSGCLAVLAALSWPQALVHATDLSVEALAVAQRNVDRHGLLSRIVLRQGDGVAAGEGRYDLILCNPPYVSAASMATLPPEYRAEPMLALAGGDDGMDFMRQLLPKAAQYLTPNGLLVLEIGHERAHFEAAWPTLSPVWLPTSASDDAVLLLEREALDRLAAATARPQHTCRDMDA